MITPDKEVETNKNGESATNSDSQTNSQSDKQTEAAEAAGSLSSESISTDVQWPDAKESEKQKLVDYKNKESDSTAASSAAESSAETNAQEKSVADNSPPLTQVHVSHLLSEVLQEPQPEPSAIVRKVRIPIIFDIILAVGLLIAVGGFTFGLFHMYLVHSASQAISEQKYKAAIAILKGAPFPQIFSKPGSDTEEMLSKATYLDAMDRLESENDIKGAIDQLNEIKAGSKYFSLAQEAINDNTEPATMMLQGGTEHTDTAPPEEEQKSLLDKTLNEEEK